MFYTTFCMFYTHHYLYSTQYCVFYTYVYSTKHYAVRHTVTYVLHNIMHLMHNVLNVLHKILYVLHTINYVLHNIMHVLHTCLYVVHNIMYSAQYYEFFKIPVFLHFYQLFKNKIAPLSQNTIMNNGDRAVRRMSKHKMF
jgi:hypothetical protein